MTREDAIRWMTVLKQSKINWIGDTNKIADIKVECEKAEQEAFDMAIEALVQDSRKVTQESDLIRRSDAINCVGWGDSVTTVIDRIKALPSAKIIK